MVHPLRPALRTTAVYEVRGSGDSPCALPLYIRTALCGSAGWGVNYCHGEGSGQDEESFFVVHREMPPCNCPGMYVEDEDVSLGLKCLPPGSIKQSGSASHN